MSGLRSGRSAVLAPGGNNNAEVPLLMYAGLAARRRGACVRVMTWELAEGRGIGEQREMVASKIAEAVDELTPATGAGPLVIGKSLGSLAAPVVADRGLAAVWFTPLLTDDLPRAFRTAYSWLIYAVSCISRYSSFTCCGVRY